MKQLIGGICFFILIIIVAAFVAPLLLCYGMGAPWELANFLFKNKIAGAIAGIAFIYVIVCMIGHTGGLISAICRKDSRLNDIKDEFKTAVKLCSVIVVVVSALGIITNQFVKNDLNPNEKTKGAIPAAATVAEEPAAEPTTKENIHPNAISWKKAKNHIGEKITIRGTVKGVFQSTQSNGNPTFINIGKDYPEDGRVTVVIWEENISKFDAYSYSGEIIYVTGELYMYDGNVQIEVSDPEQIEVE